jgi:iron complex transport system ATP-binding protein
MGIEVKNLSFSYGDRQVLKDISFSVKKGEFLSILGANGVGKSTLLRCILGLLPGYNGKIRVDEAELSSLTVKELAKHIAYIPQTSAPTFNYSVYDIVLMGLTSEIRSFASPGKKEKARVCQALQRFDIGHLTNRCFHRLSGGEKQLVLLARAIVQNAPVLMLDEPTASLDFGNRIRVMQQAKSLAAEGYTIIQTTHEPELCYLYSDRILAMKDGAVFCDGTPKEIMTKENIRGLYGVDVQIFSLLDDRARICLPADFKKKELL